MTELNEAPLSSVLVLPNSLTVAAAEALRADFLQYAQSGSSLLLDAAAVEVITTPGVQLLLSLSLSLRDRGAALRLRNARPSLSEAFEQLGLGAEFAILEE